MQAAPRLVVLGLLLVSLAAPAAGQAITPRGEAATLDAATWNVEWFGHASNGPRDDERQLDLVEDVIRLSEVDLWALQEIDSPAFFARLLDSLGTAYGGVIRDNTAPFVTQRLAYVYRRDVVVRAGVEQILTQYSTGSDNPFAYRPPLKLVATIVLPDTTVQMTFITLHMKAGGDGDDHDRRREAALRLKNRIDALMSSEPVVVLGDFNDELGGSIAGSRPTPYGLFLDDPNRYRFLTRLLDQEGVATHCGGSLRCTAGSTLDHILVTDELFGAYVEGSADRYGELVDEIGGYVDDVSDHLPVLARFDFSTAVAVAGDGDAEAHPLTVHPNPAAGRFVARYGTARPGPVRLALYDALGRRVALLADGYRPAGRLETTWAGALPAGVYLLRLAADGRVETRPVVVTP